MIIFAKRLRERQPSARWMHCSSPSDAFSTQPSKKFSTKVNHRTYFFLSGEQNNATMHIIHN